MDWRETPLLAQLAAAAACDSGTANADPADAADEGPSVINNSVGASIQVMSPLPDERQSVTSHMHHEQERAAQVHPVRRKAQLQPLHQVRSLREEAQRLELTLQQLCTKWRDAIPDQRTLRAACAAAKQRVITKRVEEQRAALQAQLLHHQLRYAFAQRMLSDSPLSQLAHACDNMFAHMHSELHLQRHLMDRVEQLQHRLDLAVQRAPALADAFTHEIAAIHTLSPLVPVSRTHVRGCGRNTVISSVFVCKLSVDAAPALLHVFRAAETAVQRLLDGDVLRRLGLHVGRELVHELSPQRSYSRVTRHDDAFAGAASTVALVAELVHGDLAVIACDFADNDTLLECSGVQTDGKTRLDLCSILVLTRHRSTGTSGGGGGDFVLLRRLLVLRYNLVPSSPVLFQELKRVMPFVNGDLTMALLCEALQSDAPSDASSSSATSRAAAAVAAARAPDPA